MVTLRPYDEVNQKQLTFEDLMNAKTHRCIGKNFQENERNYVDYRSFLEMLINVLVFDVDSPESKKFKTSEEL